MRRKLQLVVSFFLFFGVFIHGNVVVLGTKSGDKSCRKKVVFDFPYLDKFKECGLKGNAGVLRKFEGQNVKILIYEFKKDYDAFSAFTVFIDGSSRFFEIYRGGFIKGNAIYIWSGKFLTISRFKDIVKLNSIRYLEWILSQYKINKKVPGIFRSIIDLPFPILKCRFYSNIFFFNFFGARHIKPSILKFPLIFSEFHIKKGLKFSFFVCRGNKKYKILLGKNGFETLSGNGFIFFSDNDNTQIFSDVFTKIVENMNKEKRFFRRDNFTFVDLVVNGVALAFLLLFISVFFGLFFGFLRVFFNKKLRKKDDSNLLILKFGVEGNKSENNEERGNN